MAKKGYRPDGAPVTYNPEYPDLEQFNALFDQTGVSNPYSEIDLDDYSLSRRGKLQYQHDLAAAQYSAEMQMMMYQNLYNSPEAQAKRMRAAGLNPDLTGVSGEPASDLNGNVTTPDMAGTETDGQFALGIVDTTLSMISAFSSGFFALSGGFAQVDAQKLDNASKALSIGDSLISGVSAIAGNDFRTDGSAELDAIESLTRGLPRKYRSQVSEYLRNYVDSSPYQTRKYRNMTDANLAKGAYARSAVDPRTSGNVEEIMEALKPMQEAEFEVAKILLSRQQAEHQTMTDYWSNKDGASQAMMENSEAVSESKENDIQEIVRRGALKSVKFLEKAMEEGKVWASTALSALYMSLSGAGSVLPSLNMSSSSGINAKGESFDNSSWNFGF